MKNFLKVLDDMSRLVGVVIICEGLTVVMLVVGVGCAKVVVTIPCLVG